MDPIEGWTHWPAPAKLNLFLHVVGRRADGYHELQTVFRLLDLSDRIGIRMRADGEIVRVEGMPEVPAEQDLAVRAARALQAATGTRRGADLWISKCIPAGGGLGGGSSDAATVLRALDRMWGCDLGVDRLAELGLTLGADVPLFVRGTSAWAEGVGERLQAIELPPQVYLLLDPGVRVATGPVFQAPELTRDTPRTTIAGFLMGDATRNDLEPVVCRRYPVVAAAIEWLGGFASARLTGSGGCVFAAIPDRPTAEHLARRCPPAWRAIVVQSCDRSQLLDRLEHETALR